MNIQENISRVKQLMGLLNPKFTLEDSDGRIEIGIYSNDEHVGGISLKYDPKDSSHTITASYIKPKYRGQGLFGTALFYLLDKKPNAKIKSVLRSTSAQRAWNSIKNKIPSNIAFEMDNSSGKKIFYLKRYE